MADSTTGAESSGADSRSKRLTLSLSSLYLDPNNYRFIDHSDYRPVSQERVFDDEVQRQTRMFILGDKSENVGDLVASFTQNGWLDVEPIHVKRISERRFLVVEGNRRVSTLKFLQGRYQSSTGQLGKLDPAIFSSIPCVLYEETDEVHHLVVMGLHHISGKKRWPPINQARLMRMLRDFHRQPPEQVCASLGVSRREFNLSLRTLALCDAYRVSDYGDQFTSEMFNMFREVLRAPTLRTWLRWDDYQEAAQEKRNLDRLFSWVSKEIDSDDDDEDARGSTSEPIITTGAQVRELAKIIEDKDAVRRLEETRSLQAASLTSDLLIKSELEAALERCGQDVNRLFQLAPRMPTTMLDRVEQLINRLQGVVMASKRQPVRRSSERPWQPYTEVPKCHFESLHIKQYRGLRETTLTDLGVINLLVGINNAGKTSILEALYLLIHQSDPRGLLETIRRRTRIDGEAEPSWLVEQLPAPVVLSGVFDTLQLNTASVTIDVANEPESPDEDWASYLRTLEIEARYAGRSQRTVTDFFEGRNRRTTLEGDPRWLCPSVLHSPFSMSDPETLAQCNKASLDSGTKERVLTFIREHMDQGLKTIELIERHRFVVTHEDYEGARDLAYFGEGLQRVFQIGLLFAGARGGVVLIDELENALHASVLLDFSRFIQELAVEFDVQVFITTHSKETVDAFVLNGYRNEDVAAFALYRKDAGIEVVRFGGSLLERAVKAIGVDIRRR